MAKILITVIGNDVHAVANKIITKMLVERGFDTWNIGVANKPSDIVDAIVDYFPDLILIGSLNGEVNFWAQDLKSRFDKLNFKNVKIFIGGNIGVGEQEYQNKRKLKQMGFDRVFSSKESINELLSIIESEF